MLVLYAMFFELNDETGARESARGLLEDLVDPELAAFLVPDGTSWDAALDGGSMAVPPMPGASASDLGGPAANTAELAAEADPAASMAGSNNWAVAGRLTESGRALVSNDMHLGLTVPGIWYQARLVVNGDSPRDVTGVTLPGTPFMIGGSNTMIAWGNTNSYGDWTDAVVLQPGRAEGTYKTAGGDRPFVEVIEQIEIKGAEPVDSVERETREGPVHDNVDFSDGKIAVSWLAHDVR